MYAETNFPTKAALKKAVSASRNGTGPKVRCFQPGGMFSGTRTGTDTIEGPHYPKPHTWYARVEIKDFVIVRVIS